MFIVFKFTRLVLLYNINTVLINTKYIPINIYCASLILVPRLVIE